MDSNDVERIFREEVKEYLNKEMVNYKIGNSLLIIPKHTDEIQELINKVLSKNEIEKYNIKSYDIYQAFKKENEVKDEVKDEVLHISIENISKNNLSNNLSNSLDDFILNFSNYENNTSHNTSRRSSSNMTNNEEDIKLIISQEDINNLEFDDLNSRVITNSPNIFDIENNNKNSNNLIHKSTNTKIYKEYRTDLKDVKKLLFQYLTILSKILTCKKNTLCWTHHNFMKTLNSQIKTPLNSIAVGIQILDESLKDDYFQNIISFLIQSCVELSTYINDIIDYYQLSQDKIIIIYENFDIRQNLEKIENLFKMQFEEKNIDFQYNVSSTIPQYIKTDGKRLCQILINLLKNSITHTEKGRITIDIQYHNADNKLFITVTDTGVGIPENEKVNVFKPFSKINKIDNKDNKDESEGLGLGLSISKDIVKKLGGNIYFVDDKYIDYKGVAIQFYILIQSENEL